MPSFLRAKGGVFFIGAEPHDVMQSYRQDEARSKEAGGILLGRVMIQGMDVIVDEVGKPGLEDRRWRFGFRRGRRRSQRLVDQAWSDSSGTTNYIGEWHTHPESVPTPSCVDLDGWAGILQQVQTDLKALFFVIVGTSSLRVWEGDRTSGELIQLEPRE